MTFTRSEREIYQLAITGMGYREMAEKRFVVVKSIKFHMTNILRKCGCKSRAELIAKHYQGSVTFEDALKGRE